jgi:hypothetical protein
MKKLLLLLLFLAALCLPASSYAQAVQITAQMRATAPTTGSGIAVPTTYYHQLTWSVSGTVATCSVTLDSSADNSSWSSGGAIGAQTCTSSGQSSLVNAAANYVRINLGTFTGSGSIYISYIGYSVGSSGTVLSGTGAPTGTCTNGSLYTNNSNGNLYSCNGGSWAAAGGSAAFSAITSGTNTTAAMVVGTGASLATSGSGSISATALNGTAFSGTSGHIVSFGAANIPADSGVVAANTVVASSPGAGLAHFAGSTQTVTSSAVTSADATGNTSGSGNFCLVTSCTMVTPTLGAATATSVATGTSPPTCTIGTAGTLCQNEGTAPTGAASVDMLYANATNHCLTALNNNTDVGCLAALGATNAFTGAVTLKTAGTATNCVANGTAANPSVVTCGSAAAGMFSCATNASTGTCQVNTTAVTANSEIFITQDQADGGAGQLNVTCNTGLDLAAAAPVLKTKATGASFTINLGTVTTNPACFEYFIVN